ncbi:malonate decarboxylase gamma subunit [Propionispira arboris]|uniref:Malonate decarboxylase gamma subunit n=1 Tax=Propionispira arboris TaxID=84035 RepID=A0A1H7BXZ5_9FIRM|nr:biotin-independent malonate decarboxylase subunit gamma [Propionispira arboris]SEJ79230.1 malonate decarboxylase gamma subunit [Propionispira arboris]
MDEFDNTMIGRGRDAIGMIIDPKTFQENSVGDYSFDPEYGPCAAVGTAKLQGRCITVIANDAQAFNDRFPVVFGGIIGMEEAYKMAMTVYKSMEADKDKPMAEKRPIVLIVDTPGNGPGKMEEIAGMNKATGGYQLALAEARKAGHPIIACVIGRAISGAFLCHGLQADHILALSKDYGTMIHVMPITSISRITKMDIEKLEALSTSNPVFAAGVDFFYKLGGVEEVINTVDDMREIISKHINEVYAIKAAGKFDRLGPWGRGLLGEERGGRIVRLKAMGKMDGEFETVADQYINA